MTKEQKPQNIVSPNAQDLASAAKKAGARGLPPVHLWNPPDCGDIDMRIARDGTWFYLGTPIGRPALVRLFSTILRKDGDRYVLVTPVEKVGIVVEDVPFIAFDFSASGEDTDQTLTFETNVGDKVVAGPANPITFRGDVAAGEVLPYVEVRRGLEARIDRKSFYRLVDVARHAKVEGEAWLGLWSQGAFFAMSPGEPTRE